MEGTKFVWKRPNDLNHPRPYFEISLDNESLLMQPINTTSECVPKDIKGSQSYTEPGQPAVLWQAGSYGSALSTLRTKLLAAMEGNFTTKAAPRLTSVAQFQQGTHVNRMTPPGWTGSPIALEAFLHLHTWHARYPKDSGNKYCLELNTPSAGVYGIAFELHTVLQHKWKSCHERLCSSISTWPLGAYRSWSSHFSGSGQECSFENSSGASSYTRRPHQPDP